MTEYLKQAPWHSQAVSDDVKRTVSEMLSNIDRDPETEIRRYSRELDGWDPDSFLVDDAAIAAAADEIGDELRAHIAFAQDQICPAELQEELAAGIPGAQHVVIEDAGHMAPLDAPAAVAAQLQNWMKGHT